MNAQQALTDKPVRYEIASFIGPCSQEDAEALADAVLAMPEFKAVGGGGVGLRIIDDDHPLFREEEA